jgi:hypothetical protein
MRISDELFEVTPTAPEGQQVARANPIPRRAVAARAQTPTDAASLSGLGRISWDIVTSFSKKDIKDFQERYEIKELLQTNAKTEKPRPGAGARAKAAEQRPGIIKGLSLAPHFYPNLLNLTPVKDTGALLQIDKDWFNAFNGRDAKTAAAMSEVPAKELLTFCAGSSKFCRQTCLVTTGQHPSTIQAAHAKMKHTNALLAEPELFVALLVQQLKAFAKAAARSGKDAIVRLNMLSDIPWYVVCPEIFEELEGQVYFYDYTKLVYWGDPSYERVRHLLDLTFSFSGSNENLCREALQAGERIAVAFAPLDPERPASVKTRTSWKEIQASGLVDAQGNTMLFGGPWLMVDGDKSDYRVDDPQPCIVALNFKQPNLTADRVPHIVEAVRESREHFAKHVPDPQGQGAKYVKAKAKKFWKDAGIDPDTLEVDVVIATAEAVEEAKRQKKDAKPLVMARIAGTNVLAGPHVPTVLND